MLLELDITGGWCIKVWDLGKGSTDSALNRIRTSSSSKRHIKGFCFSFWDNTFLCIKYPKATKNLQLNSNSPLTSICLKQAHTIGSFSLPPPHSQP